MLVAEAKVGIDLTPQRTKKKLKEKENLFNNAGEKLRQGVEIFAIHEIHEGQFQTPHQGKGGRGKKNGNKTV